jgi:hypothetical protein
MLAKCERDLRDEQLEAQVDTELTSVVGAGVEPAERLGSNSSRLKETDCFVHRKHTPVLARPYFFKICERFILQGMPAQANLSGLSIQRFPMGAKAQLVR